MTSRDDDLVHPPVEHAVAARIAHDLNNVLTVIDASVYFIARTQETPAERENLEDLRTALLRGRQLVAELAAAAGRR